MQFAAAELRAQRAEKFEQWAARVGREPPLGHCFTYTPARPLNWTPLRKPLAECTVALVTTAGVHLQRQEPFSLFDEHGDWSSRPIPGDVDVADLRVSHTHYDTRDAEQDINVVFPIERLRELAAEKIVGRVSPLHFGFMGFIPNPAELARTTAPAAAAALAAQAVDVALLTAG
jgi:D-proline reductase (dithiol) PrdB